MKKLKIELNVTEDNYTYAKNRLLEYLYDCYDLDDTTDGVFKAIDDLAHDSWSDELYALLSNELDICIETGGGFLKIYIDVVMIYLH